MGISGRKSQGERPLDDVRRGLTRSRLLKAGLIAGAVAGLSAGSAGISSLRRRMEGHGS
jgi:hypothetical protein